MSAPEAVRSVSRLPVPQSLWVRLVGFLVAGNYGRIEMDVIDGRVVACRITQTIRVHEDGESDLLKDIA